MHINDIDIANIYIALFLYYLPFKDLPSPPLKTFICSNIYSYKGTHFTVPSTLFLIPNTPSTVSNTITTPISLENIIMYLVITVFIYINIIYKQITKIVKDIRAIDY